MRLALPAGRVTVILALGLFRMYTPASLTVVLLTMEITLATPATVDQDKLPAPSVIRA